MVMQMKIVGLIAEYNPFHNGHIYHIEQIKKLYPNSLLILVLNGYFLERGEISVLAKETKTKLALKYKKDIISSLDLKPNQTFLVNKYKQQAGYFTEYELKQVLQKLRDLDYEYKNGLIDLQIGIESILCAYCSK